MGATMEMSGNGSQKAAALVHVESSRAVAEAQSALVVAKRFPRDETQAIKRIENACARPTLAAEAIYSYPRGGQQIEGPSIRLAEVLAQAWGNIQFGIRELEQVAGNSTMQAYAWDVETNTRREMTFQVAHTRVTRKGTKELDDPRDIYELTANQGNRRLRACILGIIPGDIREMAVGWCSQTMQTNENVTPERISALLDAFSKHGVTKKQIEKRLGRPVEMITPVLLVNLRKIYLSLKDGVSSATDWFDVEEGAVPATPVVPLEERIAAAKRTAVPDAEIVPEPAPVRTAPSGATTRQASADSDAEFKKQLAHEAVAEAEAAKDNGATIGHVRAILEKPGVIKESTIAAWLKSWFPGQGGEG